MYQKFDKTTSFLNEISEEISGGLPYKIYNPVKGRFQKKRSNFFLSHH